MPFLTSSAASGVMGFLTKGVGSKLIAYVVVIWVLGACTTFILGYLPKMLPSGFFGQLPSYFFYFVNLFMLPAWISTRLSVAVTRWALSMIPVIGPKA